MPVFECVSAFIESAFTAARSIQKDSVKDFICVTPVLPGIECDRYLGSVHALQILQELGDAFPTGFIGDNMRIGEILGELRGLSSWTGCHIEDQKWVGMNF